MRAFFENLVGPNLATPAIWLFAVLVIAALLFVMVRVARLLTSGTFVMGGRNRKQRLAVMDAAAVDTRRRLVLVRRDDVEHLILIGGPTDVVVEQNIQLVPKMRPAQSTAAEASAMPDAAADEIERRPPPAAAIRREQVPPRPMPAPVARAPEAPRPPVRPFQPQQAASIAGSAERAAPTMRPAPQPPVRQAPPAPQPSRGSAGVAQTARPAAPATGPAAAEPRANGSEELDQVVVQELETSFDDKTTADVKAREKNLQDEMSRLLGSLGRGPAN